MMLNDDESETFNLFVTQISSNLFVISFRFISCYFIKHCVTAYLEPYGYNTIQIKSGIAERRISQ